MIAITRRGLAAAAFLPVLAPARSGAQPSWRPDRPLRLIVGFAPGGTADAVARLAAAAPAFVPPARARIVVSGNDAKRALVNGAAVVVPSPPPDTVSLVDLSREPFRVVDTATVGTTVEGVMASPDGRHAVAVAHNGSSRPAGHPLRGRAIVRLLRIEDGRMRVVGEAPVGDWAQGMAFSRDGRTLLIGHMTERTIGVYAIAEDGIRDTGRRIPVAGGPAALATGFWPR